METKAALPFEEPVVRALEIPSWLYAFYPTLTDHYSGYGKLLVKVIAAKGLPAADWSLTGGASDPYALLHLGDAQVRTRTVFNTLKPEWNEHFVFDVRHPNLTLKIVVHDHDIMSSDDFLGQLNVPLSALMDQEVHEGWFMLDPEDANKDEQCGAIHLSMRFTYDKAGEFFSHFVPFAEPEPDLPPFSLDEIYANLMKIKELIWDNTFAPCVAFVLDVIYWQKPFQSAISLVAFVYCCLCPPLAVLLFHLGLIVYMCLSYFEFRYQLAMTFDATYLLGPSNHGRIKKSILMLPSVRSGEDKSHSVSESAISKDSGEDAHLPSIIERLAVMLPGWLKETLRGFQPMLSMLVNKLILIRHLFNWKDPVASKPVFMALLGSLLVHMWWPFRYTVLLGGVYVLTMQTTPTQVLLTSVNGVVAYLTRKKSDPAALKRWNEVLAVSHAGKQWRAKTKNKIKQKQQLAAATAATAHQVSEATVKQPSMDNMNRSNSPSGSVSLSKSPKK
eukprot:GILJ01009103.1.p1 GENE.GILJ01009103.1~~GILJ01009103.1.p1  ORF type:complete len:590 (-),score=63.70 GILJ01009103.1:67-1572(-)